MSNFECRICGSAKYRSVLDLGPMPPVNTLHRPDDPITFYPLHMVECGDCGLWQLLKVPVRNEVFPTTYPYRSKTTKELIDNFVDLSAEIKGMVPGQRILDIGGNDGSLLRYFDGWERWNVEPTDAGDESAGLATWIKRFWGYDLAKGLGKGVFDVITATNVFAHADDLHNLAKGVAYSLSDDGVFAVEVQDRNRLVFDTIYHEHVAYYRVKDVVRLMGVHGLHLVRWKSIETHGGSLRLFFRKTPWSIGIPEEELSVKKLQEDTRVQVNTLRQRLTNLRYGRSLRMWGVGAPSRATTLLHYSGIHKLLDGVAEMPQSPKVGLNMPGTQVPVRTDADLLTANPGVAIILSWHLFQPIRDRLRSKGYEGDIVQPLRDYSVDIR